MDYRSDIFFGLKWRWKIFSDETLSEPIPYCEECDLQLYPEMVHQYPGPNGETYFGAAVRLHCENCAAPDAYLPDKEFPQGVPDRVEREIQRKLRDRFKHTPLSKK